MTIPELENSMTYDELAGWIAYYRLEPWGAGVDAIRHAELCHIIVSLAGGKSTIEDFLPDL